VQADEAARRPTRRHTTSGLLLDDPLDVEAYGAAVSELLDDSDRAEMMSRAAHERVRGQFLGTGSFMQCLQMSEKLISTREGT